MKLGTKSVLYGAHAFWLHPFFVAAAWKQLYGFPWDPRLWVAFLVHDLGYWGCSEMDGPEGKEHPWLGAKIMHALFDGWHMDAWWQTDRLTKRRGIPRWYIAEARSYKWHDFTLYHSRSMAKKHGVPHSKLCVADKLATALTPWWLYLPMVKATGEIEEYIAEVANASEERKRQLPSALVIGANWGKPRMWFKGLCEYLRDWSYRHAAEEK